MTSYDAADRPDLDPAYGLHLHDPRFLKYVGALESAQPHTGLFGSSSVAARRWAHHVEFAGVRTVCDITESDYIRSHAFDLWT